VAHQVTQLISLHLVSVNAAYRNVLHVGRVKTKAYKDWQTQAKMRAILQPKGRIEGPYAMHVEIDRPDNRRRDLSNLFKTVEDFIVQQGYVEDDSLCERIKMKWTQKVEGRPGPVRVWLIATTGDDSDE
jgi:Holliday junction resolvase RusA-like endonuclease